MISNSTQALTLWKQILLHNIKNGEVDLTMRQTAIMLIVYLNPPPHTVTELAKTLGVAKPVITRALNSMSKENLVRRIRDEDDKRNVLIQRTPEGAEYLERLSQNIILNIKKVRDEI